MIAAILDFLQFGPHEVPFVAPLMTMGALGFVFILWFINDIEKERKADAAKNLTSKTNSQK
ncbi:MAG TPA: hypothetical protein ENJ32_10030 [Crenotrichaceae bacterium]|nr:hypothetical protein [Crenotrichaceae bacterium]